MIIAFVRWLGSFWQGNAHLFNAGSSDAPVESSSVWLRWIVGILVLSFLFTTIYFDGKRQKLRWLNQRQNTPPLDED